MPRMTMAEVLAHQAKHQPRNQEPNATGSDSESRTREKIIEWCNAQQPRWKVIWARSDMPSTIPVGCHDLTILAPGSKTYCVELKTRLGKLSQEQTIWKFEVERLGHSFDIIRSFEDFIYRIGNPAPF